MRMTDKEILLYNLGRSEFPTFNPDPALLPSTISKAHYASFNSGFGQLTPS